jgi:hypothetical protein
MNGEVRHPWQRPLVPQFVAYALVLGAYVGFLTALLYILFDSPA